MTEDFVVDSMKLEPPAKKVTPEEFLGPNAKLVDFDDLIAKPTPASKCFGVLPTTCYLQMHCMLLILAVLTVD